MEWKLTAARSCLLFLALALHVEAARPQLGMLNLLDEESTLAKLRFEAGDPACARFQFPYNCFDDGPPSSHTSTPSTQELAAVVKDAQVLPEDSQGLPSDNLEDSSDCGPLGRHKYRCVPPTETTVKTPAPEEVAEALVQDAQIVTEHPSDCGPLGRHKFRCVPPMKTSIKTPTPVDVVSPVGPSVQPAQSDCGPLSKHKYRCDPPVH